MMLLLIVFLIGGGLYCVFIYVFFNHGRLKNKEMRLVKVRLLDYIVLVGHCFPLMFFMVFISILVCFFSL